MDTLNERHEDENFRFGFGIMLKSLLVLGGPTSVAPLYFERRVRSYVRRELCEESELLGGPTFPEVK